MNYQQVLSLPYVLNLVESIVNSKNTDMSNNISIIRIDEEYYYKYHGKKDLHIINNDFNNEGVMYRISSVLDTIIKFEEFKYKPLDFHVIQRNNLIRSNIDQELLRFLYLQYTIDKTYFYEE